MAKYRIHLKINERTYYIQKVDIQEDDNKQPISTLTWTVDKKEAETFEKDVALHMLQVLSSNGRDYRSSSV